MNTIRRLLDTAHLVILCHFMYFYMVTNFADLEAITVVTRSLCV